MQRVAFNAVVVAAQAGVGIVRGTNPDLMTAGKAQPETDAVFELEGLADVVVFKLGIREERYTHTRFDIGLDVLAGKLVVDDRRERLAVVTGCLVTFPVGLGAAPETGESTDVGLPPALVPIKLHAQPVGHG